MKTQSICLIGIVVLSMIPSLSYADAKKRWVSNPGLNTPDYYRPVPPQPMPNQPPHGQNPRPPHSHPSHRPPAQHYPPQNGINIIYRAPTTVYQSSNHYSWVNGEPNSASIKRSEYVVITDWRRLGLAAPPSGMHWILENGRYMLVYKD